MPIAIRVLSGARRGEELTFDKTPITVGDARDCDVYFGPRQDPGASGKQAALVLHPHGWSLHNQGDDDWYLNQSVVPSLGASLLRSGDIVRLSEQGPDFRFTILAASRPLSPMVRPTAERPAESAGAPLHVTLTPAPGAAEAKSTLGALLVVTVLALLAVVAMLAAFLAWRGGRTERGRVSPAAVRVASHGPPTPRVPVR